MQKLSSRRFTRLLSAASIVFALVMSGPPKAGATDPLPPDDPSVLSMLFASDPQFPWWRTGLDPSCNSEACVQSKAIQTNTHMKTAMNAITTLGQWPSNIACRRMDGTPCDRITIGGAPINDPAGVIINGDLTAYFHQPDFAGFAKSYFGLPPFIQGVRYRIYPGLGNHDYKNNTFKLGVESGAFGSWGLACCDDAIVYYNDWNRNAKEAVWFMAGQVENLPNVVNRDLSAYASLDNEGGFAARLIVGYDLDGQRHQEDTGSFPVVQRRAVVFPRRATNIDVQIQEHTGFEWRIVNTYHHPTAHRVCYEVSGTTLDPDSAPVACIKEWPSGSSGSLAYSFDIGNFHFVQLQYRPDYHYDMPMTRVLGPVTTYEIDESPSFSVTTSYEWLKADLAAATAAGKFSVLNMHDAIAADCGETCTAGGSVRDDPQFRDAIANQNVIAVFAGHVHSTYGLEGFVSSGGKSIPVFLSGAAEYERFLLADFHRKYFTVAVINSSSGQPALVAADHDQPDPPNPQNATNSSISTAPVAFVINRPPSLEAHLETAPAREGSPLSFRATASDPDGDEVKVDWKFGSGNTATGLTPVYTYADNGNYSVEVAADDGWEQGRTVKVLPVKIENVPPTLTANTATIDENGMATVSGTIADPGVNDTFTLTIDWKDGSPAEPAALPAGRTSYSLSHRYLDDNPTATPSDVYAVHLVIKDKDGGEGTADTTVTVRNVRPTVNIDRVVGDAGEIALDESVVAGLALTSYESYTDAGSQDTRTATRSWGGGTPLENLGAVAANTAGAHTYDREGTFSLTVTVTDDDTGVSSVSRPLRVVTSAGAMAQVVEDLSRITAGNPAAARAINDALASLRGQNGGAASNGALDMLARDNSQAALEKLEQAIGHLESAETADPSLLLVKRKSLLILAAKAVVVKAIARAEAKAANNGQRQQVAAAKDLLGQGQSLLNSRDYSGAVKKFRQALSKTSFA
jgi:PKD repeat protein